MLAACKDALRQIQEMNYAKSLEQSDVNTILKYEVACYKKEVRVVVEITN